MSAIFQTSHFFLHLVNCYMSKHSLTNKILKIRPTVTRYKTTDTDNPTILTPVPCIESRPHFWKQVLNKEKKLKSTRLRSKRMDWVFEELFGFSSQVIIHEMWWILINYFHIILHKIDITQFNNYNENFLAFTFQEYIKITPSLCLHHIWHTSITVSNYVLFGN